MKKLLAGIIAIVVGYYAVKLFWWLFTSIWAIAFSIMSILAVMVVAVPLYLYLSRKLLR
jgi:Zn-dependent protease with chaperone function